MTALRGIQISKSYGHYEVLREINLEIARGECFALFGANGAGKTTLLRIFATLYRPSSGRFEIMGRDGVKERDTVRAHLMLLAHGSHLYEDLNPIENIRFFMGLRGKSPSEREIQVVLDRVGIGAFQQMKIRYFSAGMKKRLSVAKAILIQPTVLFLDEPFTSLDEAGTTMMQHYISETLSQGGTILMSTHDHKKASAVAHRAGVLSQGVIQDFPLQP